MLIADAVPGEDFAVFLAGVLVLAGALLGLLGYGRRHAEKSDAKEFELASLALTSFGTALGLWSLAGKGWDLLLIGVGIFALASALIIVRGRAVAKREPQAESDKAQQGERSPHGS